MTTRTNYNDAPGLLKGRKEFKNRSKWPSFSAKWETYKELPNEYNASSEEERIVYRDAIETAKKYDKVYVVYSYETPIFIADKNEVLWANPIKYSPTTSRQQSLTARALYS